MEEQSYSCSALAILLGAHPHPDLCARLLTVLKPLLLAVLEKALDLDEDKDADRSLGLWRQ